MSDIFYLKKGDTSPSIRYTLSPTVDLTGATVRFSMRNRATGAIKINRATAGIVAPATGGVVQYNWTSGDVDTAGEYQAEFEITHASGTPETFPNYGFIAVKISEDIA